MQNDKWTVRIKHEMRGLLNAGDSMQKTLKDRFLVKFWRIFTLLNQLQAFTRKNPDFF
jgi:hypothetical protein